MNFLVSYDLNKPGKDYSGVQEAIKKSSTGNWCKPLESVYIIESNLTVKDIYENIRSHLDVSDRILIIEITSNSYWYLDSKVSEYLEKML